MAATTGAGMKPGTPSRYPKWEPGIKALQLLSTAFPGALAGH